MFSSGANVKIDSTARARAAGELKAFTYAEATKKAKENVEQPKLPF